MFHRQPLTFEPLTSSVRLLIRGLVDFVFPPRCPLCSDPIDWTDPPCLCPSCLSKVSFVVPPFCTRCGIPFASPKEESHLCGQCMESVATYGTARAICQFSGPIRRAIHAFKYENKTHLAKTLIGLMEKNRPSLDICAYDLLVPIPLHKNRLRQRGYNQSLLLARELHRWYATPVNDRMVRRVRDCAAQIELVGAQRLENVKGVFSLGDDPTGKTILLVDDVLTTGATVSECAKVLLRGGARVVDVLTVARAV